MLNLFVGLDIYTGLLLLLALAFVLFYEAINGFHDTANAVATVIYTRAMQPQLAVVMAAFFNFFGVLLGGLSVAYAIVHMLPTDLLLNMGSTHGLAMVFSMLLAAIIWNLGTWFFGLPASSSHTLIGAIIGIGLTNALLTGSSVMDALNLREVTKIFSSLIVSPIVGLVIAGGLIFLLRRYWSGTKKRDRIHRIPEDRKKKKGKRKPPFWTRIALIVSAAGVAFSHGANDGQKGIGLVMLVLVGIAPAGFVVNMNASGYEITRTRDAVTNFEHYLQQHPELPQKLIAMEPPLPAASTDGTQVTEFHCHPANTFDAIALIIMLLAPGVQAHNFVTGKTVTPVYIQEGGELLLNSDDEIHYQKWNSTQLAGKVRIIQYIAGRKSAKKKNSLLIKVVEAANFPQDRFQPTTIVNTDDAIFGTGYFVVGKIEKNKRRYPWAQFVIDGNGQGRVAWRLPEQSSTILVLNKAGQIQWAKDGSLTPEEVDHVIALAQKLINE
ncbi:YtfJ family protein [Escherichia coli]